MNIQNKKLIIFDLDGTLAPSKTPIETKVAELVVKLLEKKKIAVISGGGYPQFQTQFLNRLPANAERYSNLLLLPTSGTRLYSWKGSWQEEYAEDIPAEEKKRVMTFLTKALRESDCLQPTKVYGPLIEDRGSQITFSGLGQSAPLDQKIAWDSTREKRQKIVDFLKTKIPTYDIRIGGASSIDITRRGVNKGYGIRKLEEYLKVSAEDILFVGDALFYGGNDYPAKATGVDCIEVSGPGETAKLIEGWLG